MRLIKEKYRSLKPTIDYLSDEVVIAQAWKKTHGYIRSFNWYADTLALDVSALTIEENVKKWSQSIRTDEPRVLELVPAAKSEVWIFDHKGWRPEVERKGKVPLRPLAHMTIRDQTWASSAMLCLADAVETAQKNCSERNQSFEQARKNKVYSYGNRLVCDWNDDGHAWFRWGNSETYRRFFTDYQNFLKRPLELGRLASEQCIGSEEVFIVNLDLSKFYNNIDIHELVNRLKLISDEFGHVYCEEFWDAFNRITSWRWAEDDIELARNLKIGNIEDGLPQGLVSAGFFANAYLINFDRKVGDNLGKSGGTKNNIIIHDYCRYVDDLRLVVSADDSNQKDIAKYVNDFIGKLLAKFGGANLKLNNEKTKVIYLSDLDNAGSMANRIEMIQNELSGPADRNVLDSAAGMLENIMSAEEYNTPSLNRNHMDFGLLKISDFDHDIRPDTIKRFAANRLESIVRNKRKINNLDGDDIENTTFYDAGNELLAKKLISVWMKDPSLSLVIRKAIEIYPDSDLFESVFDAIFERSSFGAKSQRKDKVTSTMMDYLLADLFRCASDFNGYFQVVLYPKNIDPTAIIELISRYAYKTLSIDSPSGFTKRQAMMLLAVINKPVLIYKDNNSSNSIQQTLHLILSHSPPQYQSQQSALFEVAAQITGRFDSYASLFLENIDGMGEERYSALEVFAKRGGPFWFSLWRQINKKESYREITKRLKWAAPLAYLKPKPRKQILSRVICSDSNGFEFEHGLLKLALGLLKESNNNVNAIGCSPNEISISLSYKVDWNRVWDPLVEEVDCSATKKMGFTDPRFDIPNWVESSTKDNKVIYWIGSILRASALGGGDFTGNRWENSKAVTYKGIRTSWYKRRMGMMHSPESLVGEFATTSNWFSDFLIRSLQWPGFESTNIHYDDILRVIDLESFRLCITNRLKYLNSLVCKSSELPVLPTQVERLKKESNFRIVTVQQLLPKSVDFNFSDPKLNDTKYRSKHREHLLSVCNLTLKTLKAKAHSYGEEVKPFADLIVFPEVSVHLEDQDVIKRLADSTGAIIFAGLVFTDLKGKLVNIARWFIPDYRESGRQWVIRDQGKEHMTDAEISLGVSGYRPCQHLIEVSGHPEGPFNLTGSICYDATDIKLAADLRNITDLFIVVAHNKDVNTFDNMAASLQYHMYQHVVISNIGEFGGSTIQAPYKERHDRLISHAHGVNQIAISTADIDLAAFKRKIKKYKQVKTKPAGVIK